MMSNKKAKKNSNGPIDDLAIMVAKGFENADKKFEHVNKNFENVDKKFEKLEDKIDGVEERLTQKITGIENRIDNIALNKADKDTQYKLEKRVSKIETAVKIR